MAVAVVAAESWETAKQAIETYTGFSPAVFFTVLALAGAFYYSVSAIFAPPALPAPREMEFEPEGMVPLPPTVQLGEVTEEELRAYDGSDPKKPLLMAIKGQIYDVSQSRMFYGPGGPYALFTGKDASRALAKMSFEQADLTGDISGLGPFEIEALLDWEYKFMSKYVKVGTVKKTVSVTDGSAVETSEQTHAAGQATEVSPSDSPTDLGGEPDHSAEPKGEGLAEPDHSAGPKGEGLAAHVAEADTSVENKEVGAGEGTKE